ncbi:unnamed protein product [Cuscuta epithymum]|uniref:Uncharacterized protein n=1 Tax=Cuscuta epithymum TaxID=186058 RepID=A0AAV0G5J8_9ASTE|nr:unnamed protein product [Cuscuta epithymum]
MLNHESDLKEFFQSALTNGVNSLSRYLLHEFERLLVSTLGIHPLRMEDPSVIANQEKIEVLNPGDWDIRCGLYGWDNIECNPSETFDCEGLYGDHHPTFSGDEFLGHVSENEKRVPISTVEDLWDSDANETIFQKALLVTRDNCLPTENQNTQKQMYKKNQRSHLMKTRSQSRIEL